MCNAANTNSPRIIGRETVETRDLQIVLDNRLICTYGHGVDGEYHRIVFDALEAGLAGRVEGTLSDRAGKSENQECSVTLSYLDVIRTIEYAENQLHDELGNPLTSDIVERQVRDFIDLLKHFTSEVITESGERVEGLTGVLEVICTKGSFEKNIYAPGAAPIW